MGHQLRRHNYGSFGCPGEKISSVELESGKNGLNQHQGKGFYISFVWSRFCQVFCCPTLNYVIIQELLQYMKKEYSHENLRFWLAVQELKRGPGSDTKIKKKVKEIFE